MQQIYYLKKTDCKMWSSDEDESEVNINDLWNNKKEEEEDRDEARVRNQIKKKLSTM